MPRNLDLVIHILPSPWHVMSGHMYNAGNTHDKELHGKETINMVCTPSEGSDQLKSSPNETKTLAVYMKNVISPWVCDESKMMGLGVI